MIAKRTAARAGMVAASAVLALSGLAGQASATSVNISSWSTNSAPVRCGIINNVAYTFCLYYSPGAEGAVYRAQWNVSDLSGAQFLNDGYGSAGAGQGVRNNAASAENAGVAFNINIYVYPGYNGDSNVLGPGRGGSFTSWLRNDEASVLVDVNS